MCDGKHSSRRDVVILSIKPKRPEYPLNQKVVPVSELLQEWDKLDAYYRGQLLKLTKSLNKNKHKNSRHSNNPTTPNKVGNNNNNNKHKSSPVNKNHSSSLSSDQFTELFGDENLFGPTADINNNNNRHNKNNLLHSRSLNSLFDEDSDHFSPPPPPSRVRKTNNLVVSIPVLTHPGDHCNKNHHHHHHHHHRKYASDDDDDSGSGEDDDESGEDEELDNFLSVPRENYQVQYGTKQKTRVTFFETGNKSPRFIIPIHIAPYKPPTAQGLNGVQIQKILYHKNDTVNVSPTTTTARTPDKPPDNPTPTSAPTTAKSVKVTESPVSTVSPRSTSGSTTSSTTAKTPDNNNATPKQAASQTPELSSSPSDHGIINKKPASTTTTANKLSSPPVNSTTGQKLKRTITETSHNGYAASNVSNGTLNGIKRRKVGDNHTASGDKSMHNNSMPVTSTSSTYPGGSGGSGGEPPEHDHYNGARANGNRGDETTSPKKYNKNFSFVKPSSQPTSFSSSSSAANGDPLGAVFIPPAAVSITDRIIKKASRPQPELIERQRRRRLESNQRKSYAMQKGDEHDERESIDLSMKSFEMIWNVPLLSPLRSP